MFTKTLILGQNTVKTNFQSGPKQKCLKADITIVLLSNAILLYHQKTPIFRVKLSFLRLILLTSKHIKNIKKIPPIQKLYLQKKKKDQTWLFH